MIYAVGLTSVMGRKFGLGERKLNINISLYISLSLFHFIVSFFFPFQIPWRFPSIAFFLINF